MESIIVSSFVNAPIEKCWRCFSSGEHIVNWNSASDEWHCPSAENNFADGGKFSWRMEAKDGSFGFNYEGKFMKIEPQSLIEYKIADGRKIRVEFHLEGSGTKIKEVFEAEETNPIDLQRQGWQAILDNFKKYVESLK